ncbi:MAG: CinA family protein, partial [Chloroflexi bacterium]|nr:CinA family protein [Chloroflexota bacterium]
AHARSDVVVSTGGLGPTSDDLTREAVAKVMGEEMRVDPASLVWLEGVFRQRGIEMPKTNIKQATLIPSATSIPNPTGTAPGWWVERDGRHIVLLPGPPRELQLMWEKTVGPRLAKAAGGGVVATRTIKTFGMTEGGIDEMLTHLFGRANPYLGIYARPDGIHLRVIARSATRADAESLIEPVEAEIRKILGGAIWGFDADTPGSRAASLLQKLKRSVAVVEGLTGGQVAAALGATERRDEYFLGGFVLGGRSAASTPAFALHADGHSEADARALAAAVRDLTGADYGIGVTAGEPAGDGTPGGAYHIAVVGDRAQRVTRGRVMPSREATMQRGATQAAIELIGLLSAG